MRLGWLSIRSSITCPASHVRDVSLHRRVPPRSYGVAILNNLSIEYFPAPVMYSSEKPPIMLRFL